MRSFIFALIATFLFTPAGFSATTTWTLDPAHSSVTFKIKHMMISHVHGSFQDVQGTILVDGSMPETAQVDITINAASIDTGNDKRDDHLRSADFFDVTSYPTLTFTSRQVKDVMADNFKLVGDLTMHGVTREVTLEVTGPSAPVQDSRGQLRRGAFASAEINRKDFGLSWSKVMETGGLVVGDRVWIELDIQLKQEIQ